MKNKIYVISLEPIETRYTCQWLHHIPNTLRRLTDRYEIVNIVGKTKTNETTSGAFLDFINTNSWKNEQMEEIFKLFNENQIQDGDKFLFTDAWNSGIIQLKYIADLLEKKIEIHSIWHAGSYDENDFLGRKVNDKNWSYNFERSIYYSCDYNYFATDYHFKLFLNQLNVIPDKGHVTGLPFEFLENIKNTNIEKEKLILFPHRLSEEKQPKIFDLLGRCREFHDYTFMSCQKLELSKSQYHFYLNKSMVIFSASLQETFGIGCVEGILTDNIVYVPDRLSYKEMYLKEFRYDSELTLDVDFESYVDIQKFHKLKQDFLNFLNNYSKLTKLIKRQKLDLKKYYNPEKMYKYILE